MSVRLYKIYCLGNFFLKFAIHHVEQFVLAMQPLDIICALNELASDENHWNRVIAHLIADVFSEFIAIWFVIKVVIQEWHVQRGEQSFDGNAVTAICRRKYDDAVLRGQFLKKLLVLSHDI